MKTDIKQIKKNLQNLNVMEIQWLKCWIDNEDFDDEETEVELDKHLENRDEISNFIENSTDNRVLEEFSKDLLEKKPELHKALFGKVAVAKTVEKKDGGVKLTPLQKETIKRISKRLIKKDKVYAKDLVTPKNSIYRIGAVITTLVEKGIISMVDGDSKHAPKRKLIHKQHENLFK